MSVASCCLWSDSSHFRTWIFSCKATFSNIPPSPSAISCDFFSLFIQNIQVNLMEELATIIGVVKPDLWMRTCFSSTSVHIHPDIGNSSRFLGPLHTQAKSRDREIVRAQRKCPICAHTSGYWQFIQVLRATSHTSQEPWPWNCESPKKVSNMCTYIRILAIHPGS